LSERNKGKLDEITLFQDEFDLKKPRFHHRRTFKTRTYGEVAASIRSETTAEVVERDEMHSYVGSKKPCLDLGGCCSAWATVHRLHCGFLQ